MKILRRILAQRAAVTPIIGNFDVDTFRPFRTSVSEEDPESSLSPTDSKWLWAGGPGKLPRVASPGLSAADFSMS